MNREKPITGPWNVTLIWFNHSSQRAAISSSLCLDIKCGLVIMRLRQGIVICFCTLKSVGKGGTWLVQSVGHATLHLGVRSLSPTLGLEITKKKKKLKNKDLKIVQKSIKYPETGAAGPMPAASVQGFKHGLLLLAAPPKGPSAPTSLPSLHCYPPGEQLRLLFLSPRHLECYFSFKYMRV